MCAGKGKGREGKKEKGKRKKEKGKRKKENKKKRKKRKKFSVVRTDEDHLNAYYKLALAFKIRAHVHWVKRVLQLRSFGNISTTYKYFIILYTLIL